MFFQRGNLAAAGASAIVWNGFSSISKSENCMLASIFREKHMCYYLFNRFISPVVIVFCFFAPGPIWRPSGDRSLSLSLSLSLSIYIYIYIYMLILIFISCTIISNTCTKIIVHNNIVNNTIRERERERERERARLRERLRNGITFCETFPFPTIPT